MFSSSQRSKRKRGVILSQEGWQRLKSAQEKAETQINQGIPYTLEELNELTGLSSHTLTKVRRRQKPVDRQTLEDYFKAFDLNLTKIDFTKPIDGIKNIEVIADNQLEDSKTEFPNQNNSQIDGNHEPSLPEGQVPLNSPFYIERSPVEIECNEKVLQPGSLIRIKAPRRMGKSSLMVRIIDHAAQEGCKTVFLSFQLADRSIMQDLDKFLQWFSASIGLGMRLPNRLDGYWNELFGSKISCKIYFEEYLLANCTQPLVLALDDVDRLFDYPEIADEFFGLLRTWHEQAKNSAIWQRLRLIVAHSTEVYIPLNVNKSPFNVGLPIELNKLTSEQTELLARQYDLNLSSDQLGWLLEMTCGQPYLTQLGLYSLWQGNITLDELARQGMEGTGIYGNHLQRLLWTLEQDERLKDAFAKVLQSSHPIEIELLQAFKLESLGLVELQSNQAVLSCKLYQSYFCDRLVKEKSIKSSTANAVSNIKPQ